LRKARGFAAHIFGTVLVFKGVVNKKWRYYGFAIAAHMLFNAIPTLLIQFTGVAISEVILLIIAGFMAVYVLK